MRLESVEASKEDAAATSLRISLRLASSPGSGSRVPNTTARLMASGRRAHHRCMVEMWPWRSDFSRADCGVDLLEREFFFDEATVGHAGAPLEASMTGSGATP